MKKPDIPFNPANLKLGQRVYFWITTGGARMVTTPRQPGTRLLSFRVSRKTLAPRLRSRASRQNNLLKAYLR